MGVPLRRGRYFEREDRDRKLRYYDNPHSGLPVEPVIVNETFAKRFLTGRDPLGVRFCEGCPGKPYWFEIIGVVGGILQFRNSMDICLERGRPTFWFERIQIRSIMPLPCAVQSTRSNRKDAALRLTPRPVTMNSWGVQVSAANDANFAIQAVARIRAIRVIRG